MLKTSKHIYIDTKPSVVFKILENVLEYPLVFAYYKSTQLIQEINTTKLVKITALLNKGTFSKSDGKEFCWESELTFDKVHNTILINEISPKKPLKSLTGNWLLVEENSKTKVTINHQIKTIPIPFIGYIVKRIVQKNSSLLLKSLKSYIESE